MIIDKSEHRAKLDLVPSLDSFVLDLASSSLIDLPVKLRANNKWKGPRGDLYHWIPVLNLFDEIYSAKIDLYQLETATVKLQVMDQGDTELLTACLNFSYMLLEHCCNRTIYGSIQSVFSLMKSSTIAVRVACLEVAMVLGEKYAHVTSKTIATKDHKNLLLTIINAYPPLVPAQFVHPHDPDHSIVMGDHYCYVESIRAQAVVPQSWKLINFQYYKGGDVLTTFTVSPENVAKLHLQQIFDKAMATIPSDRWLEFGIHVLVAKAFHGDSPECIGLRHLLLRCKLQAIAFLVCDCNEDFVSSRILEPQPYVFSFLVDMIQPETIDLLPDDILMLTIKTLECFSLKKVWGGDLIRCLGGNVNHATLYQVLRHIHKRLKQDSESKKAYIHFLNMVGNLISTKTLVPRLANGGMLKELMAFLDEPHKYRWHALAIVHLITLFLTNSPDSVLEFIDNHGFRLLIDTIGSEVTFALENPGYDGGAPTNALVYFSISSRQATFIKNLVKLVAKLMQWENGDRLRNLFDTPILHSFNKILENPGVFGPLIVSSTIDTVFYIIHNEPTAFSILSEANVIDTILDNFERFFLPHEDLLLSLLEVIGAICLNNEGLRKIIAKNCVEKYFQIFLDPELCRPLVRTEMASSLGNSIDELGRHFPSLKPFLINQIKMVVREIPKLAHNLHGTKHYTANDAETEFVAWESMKYSSIYETAGLLVLTVIRESTWGPNILNSMSFQDWIPYMVLDNSPHDFILTGFMSYNVDLIQVFEDNTTDYGLSRMIEFLRYQLEDSTLQKLITCPDDSYFTQAMDPEQFTIVFQKINNIITTLFTLSNGYFKWGIVSHERYVVLTETLGCYEGFKLLADLGKLLARATREENYWRTNVADDIARTTAPKYGGTRETPKLRIHIDNPKLRPRRKNVVGADHVTKNVMQIRSFSFHLQHCICDILNYLSKICMHRRQEYNQSVSRRQAVQITTAIATTFRAVLDMEIADDYQQLCFQFMISSIILHMTTIKEGDNELVQVAILIMFLDKGVMAKLSDIAVHQFHEVLVMPRHDHEAGLEADHEAEADLEYVGTSRSSVVKNSLQVILRLFEAVTNFNNYPGLPGHNYFFHSQGPELYNIVEATLAYCRIVAGRMITRTIYHPAELVHIPPLLMTKVVNIQTRTVANDGVEFVDDDGNHKPVMFVPLHWKNVSPPIDQVQYLKSIGVTETMANYYFKNAIDLEPLRNGEWPGSNSFIDDDELQNLSDTINRDDPQFESDIVIKDCSEINDYISQNRLYEWFKVYRCYPELAGSIAKLCRLNESILVYIEQRLDVATYKKNCRLYAAILDGWEVETVKQPVVLLYKRIVTIFLDLLGTNDNDINDDWASASFQIVHQALGLQSVQSSRRYHHYAIDYVPDAEFIVGEMITPEMRHALFSAICGISALSSPKIVSAVVKVLILLTNDESLRVKLADSPIIRRIIECSSFFANNTVDPTKKDQQAVVVLLRRCFETSYVVENIMDAQIERVVAHQKTKRSLPEFLKDFGALPFRNPTTFTKLVSQKVRLYGIDGVHPPTELSIVAAPLDMARDMARDESHDESRDELNSTLIIHTILGELVKVSQKDIWTSTDDETTTKKDLKLAEIFKNPDFTYTCFLLQTLTELLGSYMHAKLEFMTFSKKDPHNRKPRATGLNILIHHLITTNVLTCSGIESERRAAVLSITKLAVLALMSTPVIDNANNPKPTKENPDMAFIRNFCCDHIVKSLRDAQTLHPTEIRYNKLVDILDLIGSLVSSKFRQVAGPLFEKRASKLDLFYIGRCMIEKHVPSHVTGVIGLLDLNFPGIDKVIKSATFAMTMIGKIKSEYNQYFEELAEKEEVVELDDDDDDEEREERDETPDLFRNSTLGMYDVEYDSDSYDEELELLSGAEEIDDSQSDMESGIDSGSETDGDDDMDDGESDDDDDGSSGSFHFELGEIEIIDENDNHYDGSDVEIIDATVGSDDSQYLYGSGEESSEYSEGELDGWIEAFGTESEDSHDHDHVHDHGHDHRPRPRREGHEVGGRFQQEEYFSDMAESDESDGDSVLDDRPRPRPRSSRRRDGDIMWSFFENLRPIMNRGNLTQIFDGLMNHEINLSEATTADGAFRGTIHIGTNGTGLPISNLLRKKPEPVDPLSNLYIESTYERWDESIPEYVANHKDRLVTQVVPGILELIVADSISIERRRKELAADVVKQRQEARRVKQQQKQAQADARAQAEAEAAENPPAALTPVWIPIGDSEVDISGTDIDPEFFAALPEDIREEVFTQYVRERRASASTAGIDAREIDPSFLGALPDSIRDQILQQESYAAIRGGPTPGRASESDDDSDDDSIYNDIREPLTFHNAFAILGGTQGDSDNDAASASAPADDKNHTKNGYLVALVDKAGVAALVRLVFVPLPVTKREAMHNALKTLCLNKQTRTEVLNLLMYVLEEAVGDAKGLRKVYRSLSHKAGKGDTDKPVVPTQTTPLVVASQTMDLVHYLLENNRYVRYYFVVERDDKKRAKDLGQYQVNVLLKLLQHPTLREDAPLMDLLSRVLQLVSRSLRVLRQQHKEMPRIPRAVLRQMVQILMANDCPNTTFRRAISAMQNFTVLEGAQKVFSGELSERATALGQGIIKDLAALTARIRTDASASADHDPASADPDPASDRAADNLGRFAKFNTSSSDQAKLLRVLTALDYMFEAAGNGPVDAMEELTQLYKQLALGSLWDALSDSLRALEETEALGSATLLLPLIEALMVVCKHSKVKELQGKDVIKYEARRIDFTVEPIENLFFSFTDEHKKLLNQMVRVNPHLMSGPFAMLVRNPRVLEFDNKKNYFDRQLHEHVTEPKALAITVLRHQVFLDSFRALFYKGQEEFRNSKLEISFQGEAGIDAGGVTREWFQVLSRQMFNPDYALFSPVASDENTYHPNRVSYVNPEHLSFFKFIGKIIGKAIFDGCYLDCHFSRAVYKRILGRKVSLKDMETLDLEYFKSLVWMLENDITDVITEDFSVETNDYGETKVVDLIPNGRNIPVTELNKHEYVRLVVEYRLQTSVADQMDNFIIGFHEIVPKELVSIFDEQELELLISGLPDIDVNDWQNNTTYTNYSPSSTQILWFWRAVKSFDNEERAKLLQFATGTSKVPLNGFKELSGANGVCKFTIHRDYGSVERLPSSHTCFNQIDLPAYESYETLRGSLLLAITEGHEGFGLA